MEGLSQPTSSPIQTLICNYTTSISSTSLSSSISSLHPIHTTPNQNPPEPEPSTLIKSKIISHPHFSALLATYVDCCRIGAPPNVALGLQGPLQVDHHRPSAAGPDPELDHFMKLYCEMLSKYQAELARPLKEAMDFFTGVELQLDSLINNNPAGEKSGVYSSVENQGEAEISEMDSVQADNELKLRLLEKYGGHLGSLRQQLSMKKKKGKLPKDARQRLLSWWSSHYQWPYPSESEKVALAEETGLELKQISNWFINQRKRHWRPSEDRMQFVIEGHNHPQSSEEEAAAAAAACCTGNGMGSDAFCK